IRAKTGEYDWIPALEERARREGGKNDQKIALSSCSRLCSVHGGDPICRVGRSPEVRRYPDLYDSRRCAAELRRPPRDHIPHPPPPPPLPPCPHHGQSR